MADRERSAARWASAERAPEPGSAVAAAGPSSSRSGACHPRGRAPHRWTARRAAGEPAPAPRRGLPPRGRRACSSTRRRSSSPSTIHTTRLRTPAVRHQRRVPLRGKVVPLLRSRPGCAAASCRSASPDTTSPTTGPAPLLAFGAYACAAALLLVLIAPLHAPHARRRGDSWPSPGLGLGNLVLFLLRRPGGLRDRDRGGPTLPVRRRPAAGRRDPARTVRRWR